MREWETRYNGKGGIGNRRKAMRMYEPPPSPPPPHTSGQEPEAKSLWDSELNSQVFKVN